MKNLIFISLLFIVNLGFSQGGKSTDKVDKVDKVIDKTSNAVERVYNDASKVVKKTASLAEKSAPKIKQALNKIGQNLKVEANKVWDILVKQQLVWSICILITILLTIGSWFHFWYRMSIIQKIEKCGDSHVFSALVTFALAAGGTIISIMYSADMMTGFINPEFGAMKTIAGIAAQIK